MTIPWDPSDPSPADGHADIVDQWQRHYLRGLLRRAFPVRRPVQHDFACGTGRAIRLLHGLVHAAHGYDFSEAMLARARALAVPAALHVVAPTGPVPRPAPGHRPLIVTCARFLATVEPPVRDLALSFAAQALPRPDAGVLVIEHQHRRRPGRRCRGPAPADLSPADLVALLARHGFRVVERRGFGLLPRSWHRGPGRIPATVDGLAARLPSISRWCATALYVARREGVTGPAGSSPAVAEPDCPGGGEQA